LATQVRAAFERGIVPARREKNAVRILVLLLVIAIVTLVARRVWRSFLALRVGAIPDDVDVPEVRMEADRGWQVTRSVSHGVATINVEHPREGVAQTWRVQLRDPGAQRALEESMRRAGLLARELSGV
jgi:hypothetical protein